MKKNHGSLFPGVCGANSSAKTYGVLAGFAVLLTAAISTLTGCGGDSPWHLADSKNPFIGQWQSDIPSMGGETGFFEFKSDGTFTVEFPDLPEEKGGPLGPFTGGYLVKDGVQVTFLSTDEGMGGFTYRVVDDNTISVTEAENDGSLTAGNSAPFTRVPGSPVNKGNTSFVLSNPLIGGKWSETTSGYNAEYVFTADGTGTLSYSGENPFSIAYTVFHDAYITNDGGADVLIVYMTATQTFASYLLEGDASSGTISVKEITEVAPMTGPPPPNVSYGPAITFTRN